MTRPMGMPKTGGRIRGTPNRRTQKLCDLFEHRGIDIPQRILDLLPKLDPDRQAIILLGLMPYLYPKRKPIEISEESIVSEIEFVHDDVE